MDNRDTSKRYTAWKIPSRQSSGERQFSVAPEKTSVSSFQDNDFYYEIEYDSCPIPGVGRFVAKPQKIEKPEDDALRKLFGQMREIARTHRSSLDYSRFFDSRVHFYNSMIFYKQGMFMKDVTDDYSGHAPFSQYFPSYQMMGYEQLRTYFTWRTAVRKGDISDIPFSYAFVYLYELLNHIGVSNPQEGLEKLLSFWKTFREYQPAIDPYVLQWLKEYHIYYELPRSFPEFVRENSLTEQYPQIADPEDRFTLLCSISDYDIRKSRFFSDGREKLITDCFYFLVERLDTIFQEHGILLEESIFHPTKKMSVWQPFKNALFYPSQKQTDRKVVLSKNEIYVCQENQWYFSTVITSKGGRQFLGYLFKQMECVLRKLLHYRFSLTANLNMVHHPVLTDLEQAGLALDSLIRDLVVEFYREATKIVVKVDAQSLSAIRRESAVTQEKLTVEEEEDFFSFSGPEPLADISFSPAKETPLFVGEEIASSVPDEWESLKRSLSETELSALSVIETGSQDLKQFADQVGMMVEVLVDGINEKAFDLIGDNLIDEDFSLYEEYKEQVKELLE